MAQRDGANANPVLRGYYDRSAETIQHLDEIMKRMCRFTTIITFFMRDLEHQRASLRILQELLDLPSLNRTTTRNPLVDPKKDNGVVSDPDPQCESSGTKSFIDDCYDESGDPIWHIPPDTTLEELRCAKFQLLEMAGKALEAMATCLYGMPEIEKAEMESKLAQLKALNAQQVLMLNFCADAEERERSVTELCRTWVFGKNAIDEYIFHALEGDCRVLDSVFRLSEKLE